MSVYVDPADHLYYGTHVQWQAPGIYSVYAHCIAYADGPGFSHVYNWPA